jgi:hypothetical protein
VPGVFQLDELVGIFAIFFILAQIIERALEPINELPALYYKDPGPKADSIRRFINRIICPFSNLSKVLLGDKAKINALELKIKNYQLLIDEIIKKEGASTDDIDEIEDKIGILMKKIRTHRARRAFGSWVFASYFGVVLCGILQVGLISSVTALVKSSQPQTIDPTLDWVLTGVLIGSGTKPLHDLLTTLEKAAKK